MIDLNEDLLKEVRDEIRLLRLDIKMSVMDIKKLMEDGKDK